MHLHHRQARLSDLDALVEFDITSFRLDKQFQYLYPYSDQYPEDTAKYTRLGHKNLIESPNHMFFVVTAQSLWNPNITKPVAYCVWQVANFKHELTVDRSSDQSRSEDSIPYYHNERRDASPQRIQAFSTALAIAREQYFGGVYGQNTFELLRLAKDPEYLSCGAATVLCNWGINFAAKKKTNIFAFTSEVEEPLYRHLGFGEVLKVTVKAEGEDEKLVIPAMLYSSVGGSGRHE